MFSFFLFFFVIIQSCDASSEHVCNYCIQHFSDLFKQQDLFRGLDQL